MSDALTQVMAYHQATKHQFHAYARGPHGMDWATQPNPFRRYEGAPRAALERRAGGLCGAALAGQAKSVKDFQ